MDEHEDAVARIRSDVIAAVKAHFRRQIILFKNLTALLSIITVFSVAFFGWTMFWKNPRSEVPDNCLNKGEIVSYFGKRPSEVIMVHDAPFGRVCEWISTPDLIDMMQNRDLARSHKDNFIREYADTHFGTSSIKQAQ